MISIELQKLPVFYHVPKFGGTYVLNSMFLGFRIYRATKTNWSDRSSLTKLSIKNLKIRDGNVVLFQFLLGDPLYILDNIVDNNNFINKINHSEFDIELKDFSYISNIISNMFTFFVLVRASGFKYRKILTNTFANKNILNYILLRDPFEAAQSFYHYSKSENSVHENTHGYTNDKTFEEYISSADVGDSWLIRNILDISYDTILTEEHLNNTIDILNKDFTVYKTSDAYNLVKKILKECHDIKIKKKEFSTIPSNKGDYDFITLDSLSEDIVKKFKKRTHWDLCLYKSLTKK